MRAGGRNGPATAVTTGAAGVSPASPGVSSGSPTVARTIHADRAAGTLTIEWADGHATLFDFVGLRWLCPCAYCRGEAGLPGWLDSLPTLTPEQTRMTDIHLVGNYAVSPHWGDGHSTGFYTFNLLRDRCPCPECTARRGQTGQRYEDGPAAHPESGHQHD